MKTSRRDFIKSLGISLATIMITRCAPFHSETEPLEVMATPSDTPKATVFPPEERIRECWRNLDLLAREARKDGEHSSKLWSTLVNEHQAALLIMVNSGDLDMKVAQQMQNVFKRAANHIEGIYSTFVMCYESMETTLFFARDDLLQQAEVLQEFSDDIDHVVLEEIRTAIAYDITYFELAFSPRAGMELNEQFEAGEMEIIPEALEAAQLLVDITLSDQA